MRNLDIFWRRGGGAGKILYVEKWSTLCTLIFRHNYECKVTHKVPSVLINQVIYNNNRPLLGYVHSQWDYFNSCSSGDIKMEIMCNLHVAFTFKNGGLNINYVH